MKQDVITLTKKQINRYEIILQALDGSLTVQQAANALNLSTRQVQRLKKEVSTDGPAALIHKNSFRTPPNAIPQDTIQEILRLKQTDPFPSANFVHFREILDERFDIHISYAALYRILTSAGFRSPKKRRRFRPHRRRARKPQAGLLVQVDATPHRWFLGSRKSFALHGAIDDATGQLLALFLTKNECLLGYFEMTKRMIENFGIPVSLYADRHTIFQSPKKDGAEVTSGQDIHDTQFGRALRELGVELIPARSPQAKGRIERVWQTLQSRLPIEFKLHGIADIDSANEFLRTYIYTFNSQFAVEPADAHSLFRSAEGAGDLDYILCVKEGRKVDAGGVFSFHNRSFQLVGGPHTAGLRAKTSIQVLSHPRYGVKAQYRGMVLEVLPFVPPKRKAKDQGENQSAHSTAHPVPPGHPWAQGVPHTARCKEESWGEIYEMVCDIFAAKY